VVRLEHDPRGPRWTDGRHAFEQAAHDVEHVVVVVVVQDDRPGRQDARLVFLGRADTGSRLGGGHCARRAGQRCNWLAPMPSRLDVLCAGWIAAMKTAKCYRLNAMLDASADRFQPAPSGPPV